jgi:tetratricopeptide (TPR) repeat protein
MSMKKLSACAPLILSAAAMACGSAAAQVKVWQGTMTLPTYEEGAPDANPPFDTYSTTQFSYPYTLRKNLTGEKTDHVWRAVFLENEYLKCTVLPDIGGHVYTCVDKISGQPMFYANPSIKKAQIGYRGAWAAFGIEFNFPVSHNWVSMSPVDFSYSQNEDGSGSVWVGNIDRVYGMQWSVELVLRPGSTLLEERVKLYNRSDVRHRYYWWNNAAVEVWDDSKIEYPMQFAASHGFTEVRRWPVGPEGADLSVIKNQQFGPVSYFVHGSREPFMGIWNPKTRTGTVHYADYSKLPAKKIWSWGADEEGLRWRKALSDNDSAYVEVQAGLFRNQETYSFLNPGQSIQFSEYWMPVRGIGGIARANKAGVVNIESHGKDVAVLLNVNESVPRAQIRLLRGDKSIWSETADLTPERTWSHAVPAGEVAKITFELKDHSGKLLLSHTEGEYDWDAERTINVGPQQVFATPEADQRSEDDWLRVAADQEANGKLMPAWETYVVALAKYPHSYALEVAAGRLAASLQHFEEAAKLLSEAQKRDTANAEAGYYLGIAEEGPGHLREARAAYEVAYRQPGFHARAAARIGELLARQGDFQASRAFLSEAADALPTDIRSHEELEAVVRAQGDTALADQLAHTGLVLDPMGDFLKEEMGVPNLPHLAADPYRVLRVATEYMELGLYAKALAVLGRTYPTVPGNQSEPGSVLPQQHPMVHYYAAYCDAKLGRAAGPEWQAAKQLSSSYVFPSSTMDRVVLEAAIEADKDDATAHYLLGTLLFSKGLYGAGMNEWAEAKRLAPHMPILDADIGKALLQLNGDVPHAQIAFESGLENDPANGDIYSGLDEAMSLSSVSAKERARALGRFPGVTDGPAPAAMPASLVYQLALTRAEAGEYDAALALFKGRFFPSEEGGVSATQVMFEIELMKASAEAAAGQCSATRELLSEPQPGLILNGAAARAYLSEALAAQLCKLNAKSRELLESAAESKNSADAAWAAKASILLGHNNEHRQQNLEASLASADRVKDTSSYTGWWWYNMGTIEAALHRDDRARADFRKVLLLPDSMMSHHLSRAAIVDLNGGAN